MATCTDCMLYNFCSDSDGQTKYYGKDIAADNVEQLCAKCKSVGGISDKENLTDTRTVHILGSIWTIREQSVSENDLLQNCDGYCDWTTKEMVVEREQNGTLGDMGTYIRKVLRHEIVHAFLFESGLYEASAPTEAWAKNEEMVDWIARQGQKIYAAWKEVGVLDVI